MTWQPIVLFGLAGLLAGGVGSFWRESRTAAYVFLVLVILCVVGGVLWML